MTIEGGCRSCLVSEAPDLEVLLILLGHLYLFDETLEHDIGQCLYEAIGNHLLCWDVGQFDSFCSYLSTVILLLDINMLSPRVEDGLYTSDIDP